MTITERYIQKVVPLLAKAEGEELGTKPMNGGTAYLFPCPFCSHLPTKSGKNKPKKKTALLAPRYESKWVYFFSCHRRGAEECRGGAKSFHNFLAMYHPPLFNQYQLEMNNRWEGNQ